MRGNRGSKGGHRGVEGWGGGEEPERQKARTGAGDWWGYGGKGGSEGERAQQLIAGVIFFLLKFWFPL